MFCHDSQNVCISCFVEIISIKISLEHFLSIKEFQTRPFSYKIPNLYGPGPINELTECLN